MSTEKSVESSTSLFSFIIERSFPLLYHTFANKSRRKPCISSETCCGMELARSAVWNHGNAVYGIKPQELYSIRTSRNAMRDFVAIPYNARGALIPYQACGLDNKKGTFGRQKFLFCWRRERDSNPRLGISQHTISSRAP